MVTCINIFFFLLYYVLSSVIFSFSCIILQLYSPSVVLSFSCIILPFCVIVAVPNQHLSVFVLAQWKLLLNVVKRKAVRKEGWSLSWGSFTCRNIRKSSPFFKALGEGSDIGGEGCLQEGVAGLSVDCAPSSPSPASSICI